MLWPICLQVHTICQATKWRRDRSTARAAWWGISCLNGISWAFESVASLWLLGVTAVCTVSGIYMDLLSRSRSFSFVVQVLPPQIWHLGQGTSLIPRVRQGNSFGDLKEFPWVPCCSQPGQWAAWEALGPCPGDIGWPSQTDGYLRVVRLWHGWMREFNVPSGKLT